MTDTTDHPSCPDPIECGHEAALGLAEMRLGQVRAKVTEWQALAPADDWGDTPQDTVLADVGRLLLQILGSAPAAASVVVPAADQAAEPVCKFDEGCHRVVPCDPGCGTPWPVADRAALRDRIAALFRHPPGVERLGDATPGEIADAVLTVLLPACVHPEGYEDECPCLPACSCCRVESAVVDRVAAETPPAETGPAAAEAPPVCEGFVWIGQSFATCDRCGQPAWDHAGEEVPVEDAGPFDTRRTVRPWKPGQAAAIRAKWSAPTVEAQPGKDTETPQPKEA
ncbi:hypothetical protein SAMN06272781_6850 [Streptomyces sp. 1222.2]|uniref:hypothetical protein n=1 Tax=Streptomyces sp. 1222.2 TaxID=1938833 RepID=UPI000BD13096|nr:hypothetical protein [Streptomyces sp. 1222.2]SOD80065.1 hypothetical protein SAMN06272781_6850 [Streptomyces sp. 1222.2]